MDSCLFCKIVKDEIPSYKIYEDDKTLSFLDVFPISEGHSLIIPKKHAQFIEELDDETASAVFQTTIKISTKLRDKLNVPATTIGIHNGRESGQEIPHTHVHVIPRDVSDGGGPINIVMANGKFKKPTDEELKALFEKLSE